ncbi:Uncharacterized protein TCM_015026 isoform 1 [Theobroma cacao]|uniref:Uncharacterized protein isoform 1 n=1 Tax=Theobroma cacao TaxID=3641 RepID=A0A061G1C0_THECC|nr:Uncharacterized protein TCM_015026 isoform 1 [Theobroma cacao]
MWRKQRITTKEKGESFIIRNNHGEIMLVGLNTYKKAVSIVEAKIKALSGTLSICDQQQLRIDEVRHCSREENKVAHTIAQHVKCSLTLTVSVVCLPRRNKRGTRLIQEFSSIWPQKRVLICSFKPRFVSSSLQSIDAIRIIRIS